MLRKITLLALCFIILLSRYLNAQQLNTAKLDNFFDTLNAHNKNMGSIAIARDGQMVYRRSIGYSVIKGQMATPANEGTKYRIGSITKMFTAVMIFQLIEEGKLTLQSHLADYFPQLPNATQITVSEMLDHRSGLHNFTNDPLFASYMAKPHTEQEMLAIFEKDKPDFAPDTKAEYSNTNFVLLGYIVEKLTGNTYAEELKKRITLKVSLTDTYYGAKANSLRNEAYSYVFLDKWMQQPETDMTVPGGAGAIVSTPADLVKFIDALFAGKLISAASLDNMKIQKDNYGMAMFRIPFYEKAGYGHTGGIDGFQSELIYFPDDKLAVCDISNGVLYPVNDILIAALSIYFNKPYTIPDFKTVAIKSEDLDKYLGNYTSSALPLKIAVTKSGNTLLAQATGQPALPLEYKGANEFVFAQAGIVLKFDPQKSEFTLLQGGKSYLYDKSKE